MVAEQRFRVEPRWMDPAEVVDAETFRFREPAAVAALAESIIREGQRQPMDVRPVPGGMQLVSGHRRLEAARMLRRDRILVRVHESLSDEEALSLALLDDLDRRPWTSAERAALRGHLEASGPCPPGVEALLRRAEAQAPLDLGAPSAKDRSLDVEARAAAVLRRLVETSHELAALFEEWRDVDDAARGEIENFVRYFKELHPFLVRREEEDRD